MIADIRQCLSVITQYAVEQDRIEKLHNGRWKHTDSKLFRVDYDIVFCILFKEGDHSLIKWARATFIHQHDEIGIFVCNFERTVKELTGVNGT